MKLNRLFALLVSSIAMLFIFSPSVGLAASAVHGNVRVALVRQVDSLDFKVKGDYQMVDLRTGKTIVKLEENSNWHVKIDHGMIELEGKQGRYGPFNGPVTINQLDFRAVLASGKGEKREVFSSGDLFAVNGSGKVTPLTITEGLAIKYAEGVTTLSGGSGGLNLVSLNDGSGTARYRGSVEFILEDGYITAINELNIEDYLCGVVPSEVPATWPAEALKAQAVAARNYAMQRVEATRGSSFNVFNNQYSQVYKGYDAETQATNKAVEETKGVVMLNQGSLITAFFHSSSGGYTENCEDVWINPLPYIKLKVDPFDKNEKHYNWNIYYSMNQLVDKLNTMGYEFGAVTDLQELAYTASGARVEKLRIEGEDTDDSPISIEICNADKVRVALGLKSAMFTLKKEYDADKNLSGVTISGSGWGHGLGLSQWGAYGMAAQGYNYQDILKYYYSDINLVSSYGRSPLPVQRAESTLWIGN